MLGDNRENLESFRRGSPGTCAATRDWTVPRETQWEAKIHRGILSVFLRKRGDFPEQLWRRNNLCKIKTWLWSPRKGKQSWECCCLFPITLAALIKILLLPKALPVLILPWKRHLSARQGDKWCRDLRLPSSDLEQAAVLRREDKAQMVLLLD